jgi:hypothetical protein
MKTTIFKFFASSGLAWFILLTGCVKDLDTVPIDKDVFTPNNVYTSVEAYKQVLAKVYAGMSVSGQQGPSGNGDLQGLDEGFGQYLRAYWYHQELPTDESHISWNDGTIHDFNKMTWSSSSEFVTNMYYRLFYQIALCNEFIRESSDAKIDERGFSESDKTTIQGFRAEARFMRALSYWHALDLFGSVPFVTEEDPVGSYFPEQISKVELFNYIESELLDIESGLPQPRSNEYGRIDRAGAWTLLAKLYLNAEVYTNTSKYTECLTYCNNIIGAGYALESDYQSLFLADNHLATDEVIFAVPFDGDSIQTWGGTTFIINAQVGSGMATADFGIGGGWWGLRARQEFVNNFADHTGATDGRAMFWTDHGLSIDDPFNFEAGGYKVEKWKNVTSGGTAGKNSTHPDTDFPLFRLADVYLMYAEAVLRGGSGGTAGQATGYINLLRERAYGDASGNITGADLNLNFVLAERARELYWEAHRRTDLVRYGRFTGEDYLWQWKGGEQDGVATNGKYNVFPIPASEIGANPNLVQNTGY